MGNNGREERIAKIDAHRQVLGLPDWRCQYSGSGAHHWKHVFGTKWWVCIYCAEATNKFPSNPSNRYYPNREEVKGEVLADAV